jgi:hypothetical protein
MSPSVRIDKIHSEHEHQARRDRTADPLSKPRDGRKCGGAARRRSRGREAHRVWGLCLRPAYSLGNVAQYASQGHRPHVHLA